jgi:hypothetical protein
MCKKTSSQIEMQLPNATAKASKPPQDFESAAKRALSAMRTGLLSRRSSGSPQRQRLLRSRHGSYKNQASLRQVAILNSEVTPLAFERLVLSLGRPNLGLFGPLNVFSRLLHRASNAAE